MADVRDRVIATLRNLPESAGYNDILEAIIIQKQIEESKEQISKGNFKLHENVMKELDRRVKGLGL